MKTYRLGTQACQVDVRTRDTHPSSLTKDTIADEVPVAMVYNGVSHAVMMASPIDLDVFAIGFSLTEGIINSANDIFDIQLSESELGIEVQIQLSGEKFNALKIRRRKLEGRTGCGLCGVESLQAVNTHTPRLKAQALPNFNAVAHAANSLVDKQILQELCGAVHAAALVDKHGKILTLYEDVGRHNALDKLIGALAAKPIQNMEGHFILVSSRASYEMVHKTASQGFACLVAISAPTSLAIQVAREANINLIGFVRAQRQVIYHQANESPHK